MSQQIFTLNGVTSAGNITSFAHLPNADRRVPTVGWLSILGASLVLIQVLDGILTAIGMERFGHHMEANPVVRGLMLSLGTVPALVLVKLFAIAIVIALCLVARHIPWVSKALTAVACLYLTAAIIPWVLFLTA